MRILRHMLRTTFVLAAVSMSIALFVSETSLAKPLLAKSTAQTKAKQVLVTQAKEQGVKVKTQDVRAACSKHAHFPNTFTCKLTETKKQCKGTTDIYVSGASPEPKTRATSVTCAKKR